MKKSDIYEIAIKIMGFYLLATTIIKGVDTLLSMISFVADVRQNSQPSDQSYLALYSALAFASAIFPILVALLFLFKSSFIVKKICPPSDFEENAKLFAESKNIYHIALVITGLILIIWSIPEFGYYIKNYIEIERNKLFHGKGDLKYLWIATVKILSGVFTLLLARQLSEYFGRSNKQVDEENSNS